MTVISAGLASDVELVLDQMCCLFFQNLTPTFHEKFTFNSVLNDVICNVINKYFCFLALIKVALNLAAYKCSLKHIHFSSFLEFGKFNRIGESLVSLLF